MSKRRVVVTGLGLITPLGLDVSTTWEGILAGRSGVREVDFDASEYPTRIAGLVPGFDPEAVVGSKDARKYDLYSHYAIAAADEALKHAGFELSAESPREETRRYGVCLGSGIGGIQTIYDQCVTLEKTGKPKRISPFFIPAGIANMGAGLVSIRFGLTGPNLATVTACTTSTHAIGLGARTIQYGDADMMVCGGAEAAAAPIGLAGFCAARALSTRNDEPEKASRPWDVDRDGFVLGDGAGVLILEEEQHALNRGATILAEVAGFGMSGDAHHITLPAEGGEGAAQCMRSALGDAGMQANDVQYINAHGTSTKAGDVAESVAVRTVFGEHADKLAVSSTKSMIGHLLGAAGSVEAAFSVLAIRDNIAPPTINLDNPDPACDLDYVPHKAREMPVDVALSNSFGFGGTNGSLIFRRYA